MVILLFAKLAPKMERIIQALGVGSKTKGQSRPTKSTLLYRAARMWPPFAATFICKLLQTRQPNHFY